MKSLLTCSLIGVCFLMHAYPASAGSRPLSEQERAGLIRSMSSQLKDPDSAKYKWPELIDGTSVYCGFVNAKNSFGGYTGFLPYFAFVNWDKGHLETAVMQIASSDQRDYMTIALIKMCRDNGYLR